MPTNRFLVTGGAGFIGSNIVDELLDQGQTVRVLDNFSTGKRENLAPFRDDIELIEGDIRSYHIVRQAVAGVDVILHQAALPSGPRSTGDPSTTSEVNVTGTLHLLEAAAREAGGRRVVQASSSSVYGNGPERPRHVLADLNGAGEAIGYQPQVGFREGLKRTIEPRIAVNEQHASQHGHHARHAES